MFTILKRFKKILEALSRRERRILTLASGIALGALILSLGFFIGNVTETVPAPGGEYTEGLTGQPTYVNPVLAAREVDKSLVRLFFNNIFDLAETVEATKDGRAWTVRLKEDIFWHDGERLTSDDVIFTVEKIQDPESRSPLFISWQGVLAQRVSEQEIQFNLGIPYAFFETNLKSLYILPKHIFAEVPVANWRISDFNLQPIGSGPYRFASYSIEPNGFVTAYHLTANSEYFGEPPLIPNFTIEFFENKESLLAAFNLGRVDGVANLEYRDLPGIKRPYETFYLNLPSYYAVFFNQSQHLALKDPKVRRALTLAIDKSRLVDMLFGGHATVMRGPIPPNTPYFSNNPRGLSASSSAARALLDEAGWELGEDGIREKTIKNTKLALEVTLTVPRVSFLTRTADLIKNDWEKVGVRVDLKVLSLGEVTNVSIKNRDYQMLLFGNILNPAFGLFSFWHSSERFYPGLNLALYNNARADRLIETIRQEFDPDSRIENFHELQDTIIDDYPAIFLYAPDYLYIASKALKGVDSSFIAEPADRFLGIPKWHLKTVRVLK